MIDRRSLLRGSAALAGMTMVGPRPLSAEPLGNPLALPPGFQMWAVQDELARDFDGTLMRMHALGYRRIEAAGWQDLAPEDFGARVRAAGLDPVSCHFSMRDLMEEYQPKLDQAQAVGVRHFVASSPSSRAAFDPALDWIRASAAAMTLADWRENALRMNEIGAAAKAMGMRFAYHNHPAEFLRYDGVLAFHELLRLTDPALVAFELDLGWVAAAGLDPAEVIDHHAERIELLHIKDIATAQRTPHTIADDLTTVHIGSGTIDWQAVLAAARRAPIASWFVEQEAPFTRPVIDQMGESLAFLREVI
ncbi:sugar phosphate isomerase/epimerase family protein [Altererythrobacter sp.]|uniref:sugar phosphate isomerase/epimerase family protein n=1 Tax=Altererythrobacter sp. TaxID=1872480 RepID=UPI003D06F98A